MKFRKKPVEIEAMQWNGPEDDRALGLFLSENGWGHKWCHNSEGFPCIKTLESGGGFHVVSPSDWVIKGVAGEFYPCKPDIFALTHDDASTQPAKPYICFHCGFETTDETEAEAHFGERDDAEEFTPTCQWWKRIPDGERAQAYQQLLQELEGERRRNEALRISNEGLEYQVNAQQGAIRSYKPFRGCRSINEVFFVYDSMEGRALAAEEQIHEWEEKIRSTGYDGADELVQAFNAQREALRSMETEIKAFLDGYDKAVRVHEGGSPQENLAASLAVSIANLTRETA